MSTAGRGRELAAAVALCLGGAFVVLVGVGRTWVSVDVPAGPLTGPQVLAVSGADLVPGVRALGLVGLAGVVALAATRRTGRAVLGVLLVLAGAGVLAAVLATDLTAGARASAPVTGAGTSALQVSTTAWPVVTALGGAALAVAGLLTVLRGRSWAALGQRYEAPAVRVPQDEVRTAPTERTLWEALDRGEDPTDTLGSSPGTRPTGEADRT